MRIICDVCNKDEASVYCSADEAALCCACDHRVHHANILAGKHPRFSLIQPSPKDSPICDICQEKKGLLFCQQDRAILCKDCDVAIHKVNEHTMNHNRFLHSGVKLSQATLLPTIETSVVPDQKPKSGGQERVSAPILNQKSQKTATSISTVPKYSLSNNSSSISEYLIETIPGWHVEDFLDSPPTFSKGYDDDLSVFWDEELLKGSISGSFSPETMGIWVPQAPPPAAPPPTLAPPQARVLNACQSHHYPNTGFGSQMINGSSLVFAPSNLNNKITKSSGKRRLDDGNCFTVPQMNPQAMIFKRSRTLR
ncbi:Zinc finger, B-box [Artemisia annua]|uniref:Zinc finger, B-box n=1 Tax=Artemisia annua TaxID=35608 RepID=A0A2U1M1Z4_ARTAN|nr:Zinc finger, B-box [Artemisia annua]